MDNFNNKMNDEASIDFNDADAGFMPEDGFVNQDYNPNAKNKKPKADKKANNKAPNGKKSNKKLIIGIVVAVIAAAAVVAFLLLQKPMKYNKGISAFEDGDYEVAMEIFEELGDYKDSEELYYDAKFGYASTLKLDGDYEKALEIFEELEKDNYEGASEQVLECKYRIGMEALENGEYEKARDYFAAIGDYKDADEQFKETVYQQGCEELSNGNSKDAAFLFETILDYKDARGYWFDAMYNVGCDAMGSGDYDEAIDIFSKINVYKDANDLLNEAKYLRGKAFYEDEKWEEAIEALEEIRSYEDADELYQKSCNEMGHSLYLEKKYGEAQLYFDKIDDMEKFGTYHFKNLEEAKSTITKVGMSGARFMSVYLEDMSAFLNSSEKGRLLYNLCQSQCNYTYYEKSHIIEIKIGNYPGNKIINAWRHNNIDSLTAEEKKAYNNALAIVNDAKMNSSNQFELERYLFDWCRHTITYDNDNWNWLPYDEVKRAETRILNCLGGLIDHRTNCQGFADTFYVLATLSGFEVYRQEGYYTEGSDPNMDPEDGDHIWNVIKLGGRWYYVDAGDKAAGYGALNCGTDNPCYHLYSPDTAFVKVEATSSPEYDYYKLNNCEFSSIDEAAKYTFNHRKQFGTEPFHFRVKNIGNKTGQQLCDEFNNTVKNYLSSLDYATNWNYHYDTKVGSFDVYLEWNY